MPPPEMVIEVERAAPLFADAETVTVALPFPPSGFTEIKSLSIIFKFKWLSVQINFSNPQVIVRPELEIFLMDRLCTFK